MTSTGPPPVYMEPQQPQTIIQQPTVVVQQNPSASNTDRSPGHWKSLRVTGYLQVAAGLISVLFGILAIVYKTYHFYLGLPVWAGIGFYIITGILGIAACRKQKSSWVTGYLTMSVIAAVVASVMVCLAGIAIGNDTYFCPDWMRGSRYSDRYDFTDRIGCSSPQGTRIAIDALIMAIGIAEIVFAVIGAGFTCSNLCCSRVNSHPMVYYQSAPQAVVAGHPQGMVQYVVMPQQQFVQQPQFGNVVYPGQQIIVGPTQPQLQPLVQPQGQVQYQPVLQGQAQPMMQAQAEAQAPVPLDEKPPSAPKGSNLPEDHHNKPLIS